MTAQATNATRGVLGVLALTILAWCSAVWNGGFAYDDREAIVGNPVVEGSLPLREAFLRDYWHHQGDAGHWRPAATLSLALDHRLHGVAPRGYHATNLFLHLLVVGLAGWILTRLEVRGAWLAGLALFAVHPALADVVAWISGRTSSLSALGGLLALGAAVRGARPVLLGILCGAGIFLAMCAKEDGVVFAPLVVLAAARHTRRHGFAALIGSCLALGLASFLRWQAIGEAFPSAPHAPLAGAPLGERLLVGGQGLARALVLAAAPLPHPPTVASESLREAGPLVLPLAAWLLWLVAAVGGSLLFLRRRSLVGASAAFAALAYAPHLQLVPSGELFAPRFLYLPLLLLTPCLARFFLGWPRPVLVGFVGLLLVGAWLQSDVYRSRASYWRRVAHHDPSDARAWNALGNAAREEGDVAAARLAYERSIEERPEYSRPWTGLGTLALEEGNLEEARERLTEAVRRGPDNPKAWGNLGVLHLRAGNPEAARAAYAEAARLSPGSLALWRGLARALELLNQREDASVAIDRALALDPRDRRAQELKERLEDGR